MDQREVGHMKARDLCQPPDDQLGHEGTCALPGPSKFGNKEPVLVRLDDGRHRAALAKRDEITYGRVRGEGHEAVV